MKKKSIAKGAPGEKRRHPRFPVGITLNIHSKGEAVGKVRGTITDLSASGMTFKTNSSLEEGAVLFLKIDFPVEFRGEVRHIKAGATGGLHRYGIRFHHIDVEGPERVRPENFIAVKFQK